MDAEILRAFTAFALVLPGVFYLGFGSILVGRPQSLLVIVIVSIALLTGIWGHLTGRLPVFVILILVLPVYQYLVFRVLHRVFVWRFQRSPQTAAFNFASGIVADRLFSVALLVLAVLLPIFGVAYMSRA
jgi:hypothetical protein